MKDGSTDSPLELQSASEPRHKQDVRHSVRLIFSSLQLTSPKLWDSRWLCHDGNLVSILRLTGPNRREAWMMRTEVVIVDTGTASSYRGQNKPRILEVWR